jgi:hypothetical protein
MSSGPIVAAVLEKENAVEDFRKLIGATNPADAAEGTIRKMFARSVGENAVHGSDSMKMLLLKRNSIFLEEKFFNYFTLNYKKVREFSRTFYFYISLSILNFQQFNCSFRIFTGKNCISCNQNICTSFKKF